MDKEWVGYGVDGTTAGGEHHRHNKVHKNKFKKDNKENTTKKHNKRGYLDVVRASRFTLRILGLDVLAVELCLMIYECVARLRINLPGGKCS